MKSSSNKISVAEIQEQGKIARYYIPNNICKWRAETFFTKEPCTIEWLRRLRSTDTLLDVGANVGMYSVYAAGILDARVYAFEPESQNFSLLCQNIVLNELEKRIIPFSAALSDTCCLDLLHLSKFDANGGGSCHSVGEQVGFDLKPRHTPFSQGVATYTIDRAIEEGMIDVPSYIKIDVDGFEHKVVRGALKILEDPTVKSLCIEINQNLSEHQDIIRQLHSLGFYYSEEQVSSVTRKSGAFTGCAEYIFDRMPIDSIRILRDDGIVPNKKTDKRHEPEVSSTEQAFQHVINRVSQQEVETDPFPCMFINDVFPSDYYQQMLRHFPGNNQVYPLSQLPNRVSKNAYQERHATLLNCESLAGLNAVDSAFWSAFTEALFSKPFVDAFLRKFAPYCTNRFAQVESKVGSVRIKSDALLVLDKTNYAIGPHTDLPQRLLSMLFYLPHDKSLIRYGTSFYKPKDRSFSCKTGIHHKFEPFDRIGSAPFIPNSVLIFARTNQSFHGVEPIKEEGVERRLLINNIRLIDVK